MTSTADKLHSQELGGPRLLPRLISANSWLIFAVGLFGLFTDEFYWRWVGHGPSSYDYLFWAALALNGPSGFVSDWLSVSVTRPDLLLRYLLQYGLWLILLRIQWITYAGIANWAQATSVRRMVVYLVSLGLLVIGCIAAAQVWQINQLRLAESVGFIDVYFWPARILGIAFSGLWISGLTALSARERPSRGL